MINDDIIDKEILRKYGDIINMPHHQSSYFPKMAMEERAAQFSPFAALTSHEKVIKETARFTNNFIELSEEEKIILNDKILILLKYIKTEPEIKITHFVCDKKKSGGEYITESVRIKKIDETKKSFILSNDCTVSVEMIADINGEIFSEYENKLI